jgi:hypothetical protein
MSAASYVKIWQTYSKGLEFTRNQWEDFHHRKHVLSSRDIREIHDLMVDLKYDLDSFNTKPWNSIEQVKEYRKKFAELNKLIMIAALKMGFTIKSFDM